MQIYKGFLTKGKQKNKIDSKNSYYTKQMTYEPIPSVRCYQFIEPTKKERTFKVFFSKKILI